MNVNESLDKAGASPPPAPAPDPAITDQGASGSRPAQACAEHKVDVDPAWWLPAAIDLDGDGDVAADADADADADVDLDVDDDDDPGAGAGAATAVADSDASVETDAAAVDEADASTLPAARAVDGPATMRIDAAQGEEASAPARTAARSSPRSPHQEAQREPRDELIAGLGRRFRGPALRVEFELRTSIARQIFRRDFVYVSLQLHALEASRRVQGIDRPRLKEALSSIARCIDGVRSQLQQCESETRALIQAQGQGDVDVAFTRPRHLQATIVSPFARDFLQILGHADEALSQLDKAWLLGLLDPTTKAQQASDCRRALQSLKEVVRQQRHVIGEHVRSVNAARRLGATGDARADADVNDRPVGGESAQAGGGASARSGRDDSNSDRPCHGASSGNPADDRDGDGDGDGYSGSHGHGHGHGQGGRWRGRRRWNRHRRRRRIRQRIAVDLAESQCRRSSRKFARMIALAVSSRRLGDLPWHAIPRRRPTAPWSSTRAASGAALAPWRDPLHPDTPQTRFPPPAPHDPASAPARPGVIRVVAANIAANVARNIAKGVAESVAESVANRLAKSVTRNLTVDVVDDLSQVTTTPLSATIELIRFAQALIDDCHLDPATDEFKQRFAMHLRRCCPRAHPRQTAQWIVYIRRLRPTARPVDAG